jgi:hypothetical protein
MTKQYDLIAIGTGTGASGAASRCRAAGWSVAVIDHLPFGGACALRGCDPKKILVGAAQAIDHSRRMRGTSSLAIIRSPMSRCFPGCGRSSVGICRWRNFQIYRRGISGCPRDQR